MLHRFCTMLVDTLSSQEQVIFMPPLTFSILNVHRGTIIQFMAGIAVAGPVIGAPIAGMLMPGIAIPARSIITLDMRYSFRWPHTFAGQRGERSGQGPDLRVGLLRQIIGIGFADYNDYPVEKYSLA